MRPRALAAALALLIAATALPAGATEFTFDGKGLGHGIGMSQYGAKGMAHEGATAEEILAHYYQGIELGPFDSVVPDGSFAASSAPVWVNLLDHVEEVVFSPTVASAQGCYDTQDTCPLTFAPGEIWRFTRVLATTCEYQRWNGTGWDPGSASGACNGSVRVAGSAGFYLDRLAREYRSGTLRFRQAPQTGKLHAVHHLAIEPYVRGVAEMLDSWPQEALRAQAIASRSYATQRVTTIGDPASGTVTLQEQCWCNLWATELDQVYGGFTAEASQPNWVAAANATSGTVASFGDSIAFTVFSSSSGGLTENISDYWGAAQVPYLVSVDDAASRTTAAANPYRDWSRTRPQSTLAAALGVSWVYDGVVSTRRESGSVAQATIRAIKDGRPATFITSGRFLREALDLPSHWFGLTVTPTFADVPHDHAFAGEVLGLSELGITQGCDDTGEVYCPDDPVTRGEMAAFLVRAFALTGSTGGDPFTDDAGVFEDDIEIIAANGITLGCNETGDLFCPDDPVTRGQMAAFLVRVLDLTFNAGGDPFTDDRGIFENEIEILHDAGITSGCAVDRYCPDDAVDRGEMAAFLVRSLALP